MSRRFWLYCALGVQLVDWLVIVASRFSLDQTAPQYLFGIRINLLIEQALSCFVLVTIVPSGFFAVLLSIDALRRRKSRGHGFPVVMKGESDETSTRTTGADVRS